MTNRFWYRALFAIASALSLFLDLTASSAQRITHIAPTPPARHQFSEFTSAAADPADSVCARYAAGSTVADPISLSSSGGQLEVTFHYQTTTDGAGLTRYCYVYTDASGNTQEAPTLHVNPGDQLIIHFYNDLPASSSSDSTHKMVMKANPAASSTSSDCSATSVDSSSSNLHFHGTTVAPVCGQDEVVHTIVPSQGEFDYNVQIPAGEPPGLYWYHPHPHGYSDPQTIGGASGALIVDGIQNVNSVVASLPTRVFVLRDQDLPASEANDPAIPQTDLSINYIPILYPSYTPAVIQTPPSEKEFWRVLNASADTLLDLQVQVGGVAQPLQIISIDGVPLTDSSGNPTSNTVTDYALSPAARVEFVVTTPAAGAAAQVVALDHNNGPDGDADPLRPLANISSASGITPPTQLPAQSTPISLIRSAVPTTVNKRTLYFSTTSNFSQFYITENGQTPTVFNMDNPPAITVQGGTVEQWTIENRSQMDHNFHIHQLHFQVVGASNYPSGVPVPAAGPTLMDTIDIPYWPGGSAPYPSVTLLMDFRDPNIVGTFVYHCHILSHEDRGMMAAIQVTPGSTATTLSTLPATAAFSSTVTLTATVAAASGVGTPTGTVTFSNGSTTLGTSNIDSTGTATLATTSLPVGAASIAAAYSGSTSFAASTSAAVPITITTAATSTGLTVSPTGNITAGSSVTCTATVTNSSGSAAPAGSVTFYNGGNPLETIPLTSSGTASYATTALPVGTASLTAAYAGNSSFSASTSSAVVITVVKPLPPTFAVSGTTVTIAPGATTGNTSTLTITPSNGFTGAINLTTSLTNSPSGAVNPPSIALSASSVTISGTTRATATATISSTAPSTSALTYPRTNRWYTAASGAALACLIFFVAPARRRGWKSTLGLLVFLVAMLAIGCGGGSMNSPPSNPGTTAGAYVFTVTGTDAATGKITSTGTINVTVN